MKTNLDHIVIAANDLQAGVDYVRDFLGVEIPPGGEHVTRGTHNHVMNIGGTVFLEVVAPSATLALPQSPRWFGLDDPYVRHSLEQSPALVGWVVNTASVNAAVESAVVPLGLPMDVTRGDLSWEFCLPEDGRLLSGGLLPYVMHWHSEPHPALAMADLGCRLTALEVQHENPKWMQSALKAIGADDLIQVVGKERGAVPRLVATLDTPLGTRTLQTVG